MSFSFLPSSEDGLVCSCSYATWDRLKVTGLLGAWVPETCPKLYLIFVSNNQLRNYKGNSLSGSETRFYNHQGERAH